MKRFVALIPLALAVSCATSTAQDASERAELLDRQAALEEQLAQIQDLLTDIHAQGMLLPELQVPEYTITPPIKVDIVPDVEVQAQLLEAYQNAILDQKKAIQQQAQARAQDTDQPMLPTLLEVPGTPRAKLELKGVDQGKIMLDVTLPNPIGGPTVYHYMLQQVGSRWSLKHVGSTEYL